jgi:hypothetical protein
LTHRLKSGYNTLAAGFAAMASAPLPPSPQPVPVGPVVPRITFWQKPWVQTVVPFVSSLFIHAAIIAIGYAFLQTAAAVYKELIQEQIIVPDSTLAESGPAGGIPNPGLGEDPNRAAAQDNLEVAVTSQGWAERPSQTLTQTLMGAEADSQADSVISIGGAAAIGRSTGAGSSSPDGAQLAPFGVPGGGAGALGPKVSFIGVGGNARKIVYLVDASGSMIDARERLKAALASSIDKLVPVQEFNIVIFSDGDMVLHQKGSLVRATTGNKQKAFAWIEDKYTVSGSTEPLGAIRAAFNLRPELIYVLTDGFDQIASFDDVKNEFVKQNRDKAVRVNTLLIRSRTDPDLEKVMKEIADSNGGVYKAIERNDF